MKKNWIIICVFVISACSGSGTQTPSIIGTWSHIVPNTKCYESFIFNSDKTLKITARDEVVYGSYSYSSETNSSSRYSLIFTTLTDNQLPDCEGYTDSDANLIFEVYIYFKTPTEIELYAQPTGGNVLVTLSSLPKEPVYNPWSSKNVMLTGRHSSSVANKGSNIFVTGGFNTSHLATLEVYNILEDTWIVKSPMQQARKGHSSHIVGSKLFVIGGEKYGKEISSVEVYDIDNNTWAYSTSLSIPRSLHASCVHNGKFYAFGGFTSNGLQNNITHTESVSSVEMYDPSNDTWVLKSPMAQDNWGMSCVTVNDKIYVLGGDNNSNRYEVYNPIFDIWETGGELLTARKNGFEATEINGTIYIMGGYTAAGSTSSVEALNTSDLTWQTKTSMLSAKFNIAQATINGSIFIFGGRNPSFNSHFDAVEKYESFMDQ